MKRFAIAAAVLLGCWLSVSMAQQLEESEPYGSGYSKEHPLGEGGGLNERRKRRLPKIPNVVPQIMPDEFLSDLQVRHAAAYTDTGRLLVWRMADDSDRAPFRISKITQSYVELAGEDSVLRIRSSAITAIHFQDRQPWKKPAER